MAPGLLLMALAATMGISGCSDQTTRYSGIWKSSCENYWGVQIRPAGGDLYTVTFCGLSGCLEPGEWMANTRIEGDPLYQAVSATQLRIRHRDRGYFTYTRCSADPSWPARSGGN